MRAPGRQRRTGARGDLQVVVVVRSNRIVDSSQPFRVGGAVGEQVRHDQPAESPISREADAAPDGRVVQVFVSRRGIQANDVELWAVLIPDPPELEAVGATGGKPRAALLKHPPPPLSPPPP